jgi:hypothetical protein
MCGSGPSQSEITQQQQAAAESAALFNNFQSQFANQQNFLTNFLEPQLKSMYENPTGFGPVALADLDANLVNTTGTQAAGARQASQAAFDTQNMAGLPSGVEQAIQSQIRSSAGNTIAQGSNQIQLANQQYKNQQQMTALSGLEAVPVMLGMSPQVGGLLTGANQNAFNSANTINQQSIAGNFWGNLGQGLLGGLINGAAGVLTGGLTGLGQMGGGSAAALDASAGGGYGAGNVAANDIPGAIAGGSGGIAGLAGIL